MCAVDHRLTLDDILAVEDNDAFGSVVCPDTEILVWPAVRNEFLRLILGDRLYPTSPLVDLSAGFRAAPVVLGATRAFIHNVAHRPRASDVLIVGTGAGLIERGGRAFNRYTDYFAETLGTTAWTVEQLDRGKWPSLPRANQRLGFIATRRLARELEARVAVRTRHRSLVSELVDLAAVGARERFGWHIGDSRRKRLVSLGARRLATYPSESRFIARLLKQVRPRLALVEEGCYGRMAVFNATARRAGVTVAEFQHGMVTRGHDAYNVSPSLAVNDRDRLSQPNAFLSYGSWWNEQFNAPVLSRIAIGSPHRTAALRARIAERPRESVVVLGDGFETQAHLDLCDQLAEVLPAPMRVVFRPHPRERTKVSDMNATPVDDEPDLYSTFAGAAAVVAEASTALFEAVGLVPLVAVWDTSKSRFYLGPHDFPRISHADDLVALLAQGVGKEPARASETWAPDWERRFRAYLDHV